MADRVAVCVGRGPSLTQADIDACRGRTSLVVINDVWERAPWADVLYAADATWWDARHGVPAFPGTKYVCQKGGHHNKPERWGCTVLSNFGPHGWSDDPSGVFTGHHSGYQAIQVAAHRGAKRIMLLGYDLQSETDPRHRSFTRWLDTYAILASAAAHRGLTILNCSRQTALTVFPCMTIDEALCGVPECVI